MSIGEGRQPYVRILVWSMKPELARKRQHIENYEATEKIKCKLNITCGLKVFEEMQLMRGIVRKK